MDELNDKIKNIVSKISKEKTETENIAKKWIFILIIMIAITIILNIILIGMFLFYKK